ncbi:MAG: antibiotic biosynthesis monooxygenase family protein [Egibacteraceae bacterium]
MSFVSINLLEVPQQMRATLEERFAARAGEVDKTDGFEGFELLRPIEGSDRYLVYTRWDSKESFEAWMGSRSFERGHAQHAASGPAATGSELWTFEVAQATTRST